MVSALVSEPISPECIEELEALQAIYAGSLNETLTFEPPLEPGPSTFPLRVKFNSSPVELSFTIPVNYPQDHPTNIRMYGTGEGMSRLQMFELELRLADVMASKKGELVLFDLMDEVCSFASGFREEEEYDPADWEDLVEEEERSNLMYNRLDKPTANKIIGSNTLQGIMEELSSVIASDMIHPELVLRQDLLDQFEDVRTKFVEKRSSRFKNRRAKDAAADRMTKIDVVFHGTLTKNVGSIVRSGFIVPGAKTRTGDTIGVRCGSTWGCGIYTSPDPHFSLAYTELTSGQKKVPSQKLIICAVLMGRRYQCQHHDYGVPITMDGYDSVVSPSEKEYVIFNPAQVLPVYVLHIYHGNVHGSMPSLNPVTLTNNADGIPNGLKERRALLTARARKHFPLGFGPNGDKFVVEEVADVDDDEEIWGEYQDDEFQDARYRWW